MCFAGSALWLFGSRRTEVRDRLVICGSICATDFGLLVPCGYSGVNWPALLKSKMLFRSKLSPKFWGSKSLWSSKDNLLACGIYSLSEAIDCSFATIQFFLPKINFYYLNISWYYFFPLSIWSLETGGRWSKFILVSTSCRAMKSRYYYIIWDTPCKGNLSYRSLMFRSRWSNTF